MPAICQTCGAHWGDSETHRSYFFSSPSKPIGSYTSAAEIIALDETMLTCPLDGSWHEGHKTHDAKTPSGGNMMEGDDRSTVGDETHHSKDEL